MLTHRAQKYLIEISCNSFQCQTYKFMAHLSFVKFPSDQCKWTLLMLRVNIASGHGLVLTGNKPLPDTMFINTSIHMSWLWHIALMCSVPLNHHILFWIFFTSIAYRYTFQPKKGMHNFQWNNESYKFMITIFCLDLFQFLKQVERLHVSL